MQKQIQKIIMTILNEMKDLDKRVTVLQEKDKARKKPKNVPGREAAMAEMLEFAEEPVLYHEPPFTNCSQSQNLAIELQNH
ncbi:hypothetical protein HPB48_011092 [Haemaphysalis longicornis]|uniref:Uncharacterized protein n=1 Tax=Haemaphysalis longicornis TaxID=44386 RepID=A0A9J6GKC1_HAELO|nr:hypothetical protein HPB48_011092 [Haemaphysalis longicornis]